MVSFGGRSKSLEDSLGDRPGIMKGKGKAAKGPSAVAKSKYGQKESVKQVLLEHSPFPPPLAHHIYRYIVRDDSDKIHDMLLHFVKMGEFPGNTDHLRKILWQNAEFRLLPDGTKSKKQRTKVESALVGMGFLSIGPHKQFNWNKNKIEKRLKTLKMIHE